MNYRRVLLLAPLDADLTAIASTVRCVATAAEFVLVVALVHRRAWSRVSGEDPADLDGTVPASLAALRLAMRAAAPEVEVCSAVEVDRAGLAAIISERRIDVLIAAPPLPLGVTADLADLRKRCGVTLLWAAGRLDPDRPILNVRCEAIGTRAISAVATFLRDHGDRAMRATVVHVDPRVRELGEAAGIAGVAAAVDFATPATALAGTADLLVLARFPGALLRVASPNTPVLILPPQQRSGARRRRAIDSSDLVVDGDWLRASIHYAVGIGRLDPIPDQQMAFVSAGRVAAVVEARRGIAELPADGVADALGVFRLTEQVGADALASVEARASVIRAGPRPFVLFDSDLSDEEIVALRGVPGDVDLLAVRLRPTASCAAIRRRLRRAGLPPKVADARAVLDEGAALDVTDAVNAVRLARVGGRMRVAGFAIAAIVHREALTPRTSGFVALRPADVGSIRVWTGTTRAVPRSLGDRLEALTGARLVTGNRIDMEMDNAKARHWLLDAINAGRTRVHLQLYMVADDDVGAPVEAALAAAAERGVTIRVVVDSLHAFDGSYGARNPLLERLRGRPRVELRVSRPLTGIPSLEDVKQRDHRKLAIVDGAVALVGGRNLSHEYYTGFDEARLGPRSLWRDVPWLDAGARAEGPVVAELERAFLDAWQVAGGAPFAISEPPAMGSTSVRTIMHHGLRDAYTLEAYIALIEAARSHVYAVNGFPLILEVQHALLRALRRGVRVCTVFGSLTPTHDGTPFGGPLSTARLAGTEMVHSRMDALVAAGADAYQFRVPRKPGWAPGLGTVNPHVHAKVMSIDGRVCSVGSANLDVTAGYFENELLLVVEDEAVTRALESRIEELLIDSVRVDRDDPVWARQAARREWMQYWPGLLAL